MFPENTFEKKPVKSQVEDSNTQVGLNSERVTSLGYPKNRVENFSIGKDCFQVTLFILNLELKGERERAQDLQCSFIAEKTKFPIGVSQNALSSTIYVTFFPKTWLHANLGMQFIAYENYRHVENNSQSYFNLFLTLKIIGIFKLFEK